jgi:hypothetical protein
MAVRLSTLGAVSALLPRNIICLLLVLITCYRLRELHGLVRPEGLGELKTIHSPHRISK